MVRELKDALLDTNGDYRKYRTNPKYRGGWFLDCFNPIEYYEYAKSGELVIMALIQLAVLILLYVFFLSAISVDSWYGMAFFIAVLLRLIINLTTYNPLHILFRRWRLLQYAGPMVSTEDCTLREFNAAIYERYSRWIDWFWIILSKSKVLRFVYILWMLFFFLVTSMTIILGIAEKSATINLLWLILPFADFIISSIRLRSAGAVERNDEPFDLLGEYSVSKTVQISSNSTLTTTYTDAQVYFLESVTPYNPDNGHTRLGGSSAQVSSASSLEMYPPPQPQQHSAETGSSPAW
eukprot:ANDGO_04655.mRNA.1 hypothetical protein